MDGAVVPFFRMLCYDKNAILTGSPLLYRSI